MTRKVTRRHFHKTAIAGGLIAMSPEKSSRYFPLRLGGPVDESYQTPKAWIDLIKKWGYGAALCPLEPDADDRVIESYKSAAAHANILIAEVGVWNNPISPNKALRKKAISDCIAHLELAEKIGALCCVNVSGSRSAEHWYGPHPKNLSEETFDMIVKTTREIIDAVKPGRTFYTLETLPWVFPHSVESYVRLLKAIDRKAFAVHCDPVNLINSPERYYYNAGLLRDFFKQLGPYIKSCHAKDIILRNQLTTHLDEIRPGLGGLNFDVYLQQLARLRGVPLIIEHLDTLKEYKKAADHIRNVANKNGLKVVSP